MALQAFSLDSLKNIDTGRVQVAFQRELKHVFDDCRDRPNEKAARTVNLKCSVTPIRDEDGDCNHVNIEFEIAGQVPKRRSRPYHMRLTKQGAFYNADAPENADQATLFDGEQANADPQESSDSEEE